MTAPLTAGGSMRGSIDLSHVASLRDQGRHREAIDWLHQQVREVLPSGGDADAERELVLLRHHAFDDGPTPPPVHHDVPEGGPARASLPEVDAADLSIEVLREAMASTGCLRVNGLLDAETCASLRAGIDRSLEACDRHLAGAPTEETEPWFVPFAPRSDRGYRWSGRRKWMRASGGVWTADSPRMLVTLIELLQTTGIAALAEAWLGERPAMSANKCNLRRTPVGNPGDWHQDGSFLGQDCTSLNFWLALSDCGEDAPTMDIVPRRLAEVAPTGTEGAMFDWSASPAVAEGLAEPEGILRPSFSEGDCMLFDHLLLHRTAARPDMPRERYAMETWLFGPSAYPEGQIPLVY
ncbi:MAG: phytanoyl-CoA dioxygenase family protein [Acidimicrobiales bacterium]